MKIASVKETWPGERRVAVSPSLSARLVARGHEVTVQTGVGELAGFSDRDYLDAAGVHIVDDGLGAVRDADLLLKVRSPSFEEIAALGENSCVIGFLDVRTDTSCVERLVACGVSALAMEMVPRTARAQSIDALSSQSSISGYKAALLGASMLGKYFPMLMTAAGTIPPARVLVLGAGVAGLQALATARRLGAAVEAFDVRSAAAEQVQSLGAKFIFLPDVKDAESSGGYARAQSQDEQERVQDFLAPYVKAADCVITTAAIPGKRAPVLILKETVADMRPGSVIVDLSADTGGNCELSKLGETVSTEGGSVVAPMNLPSDMPLHASELYSRNIGSLVELLEGEQGELMVNLEDEVVSAMCVAYQGEMRISKVQPNLGEES